MCKSLPMAVCTNQVLYSCLLKEGGLPHGRLLFANGEPERAPYEATLCLGTPSRVDVFDNLQRNSYSVRCGFHSLPSGKQVNIAEYACARMCV